MDIRGPSGHRKLGPWRRDMGDWPFQTNDWAGTGSVGREISRGGRSCEAEPDAAADRAGRCDS